MPSRDPGYHFGMVTALGWVAIAAGFAVVIALAVNVAATRAPNGFILRSSISVASIVVAGGIASLVLWLLGVV